jgi:hypothetical protein
MKKILLSMAALSALAVAAPAVAQTSNNGYQNRNDSYQDRNNGYRNQDYGYTNGNISARIARLQTRIQAGVQNGTINRQQAFQLREQVRQLTRLERQYSINGLTGRERSVLQQRLNSLRQQIRMADRGGNGRWDADDRYSDFYDRNSDGWDDRDANRDGRWDADSRYDSNRDGWDDRDSDRDGRWQDDVNDGRYQGANNGGVIGQVLDSITGGGMLRVGQRAPDNLYGVPSEYRGQYRDGSGVYYRSDNRAIYQIEARGDTVVRVYPLNR